MWWLLIAFIEPIFDSAINVVDSHLVRIFKNDGITVFFYTTMVKILFLPLLFFFGIPLWPTKETLPFFILLGIFDSIGMYFYLTALQKDDTSVIASLFSFSKIMVPILAFFIVGELLLPKQYLGFIVVVGASSLLTLRIHEKGFHFNKSLWLMIAGAFFFSFDFVIFKYILSNVDWVTAAFWSFVFSVIGLCSLMLIPSMKKRYSLGYTPFRKKRKIIAIRAFMGLASRFVIIYVISLVPVTIARTIGATQPFFVLLYAVLFGSMLPGVFKENIEKGHLVKKVLLFSAVIVGLGLVVS